MRSLLAVLVAISAACGNDTKPSVTQPNNAKNERTVVILMVGDGMGRPQIDASSMFEYGDRGKLFMEQSPTKAWLRTTSLSGITDSAAAATAFATGQLTFNKNVGLDFDGRRHPSIIETAKSQGFATGVVTTTSLSHATPAGFVSFAPSRNDYSTINPHIFESSVNLLLGGGLKEFNGDVPSHFQSINQLTDLKNVSGNSQIIGMFSESDFPYIPERSDAQPSLSDMAIEALNHLTPKTNKVFLLIEGGRIDHGGHQNDLATVVGETLEFDQCIKDIVNWNQGKAGLELLVTADHETGGLTTTANNGKGELPTVQWRWKKHTNQNVPLFAWGEKSKDINDSLMHHVDIHNHLKELILIDGNHERAPQQWIPDGYLNEVNYRQNANGLPSKDMSSPLVLTHNSQGIGIGLKGLQAQPNESIVVLLDRDYGTGNGIDSPSNSLDDHFGAEDKLLSSLKLPASFQDEKWGAEFAVVSIDGADSSLDYQIAGSSFLGFTKPSEYSKLTHQNIVLNYGEQNMPGDTPLGMEIFIPWNHIYPSETTKSTKSLAVAAFRVNTTKGTIIETFQHSPQGNATPLWEYNVL